MQWWAEWWDSTAQFFGYDEWVWGSAADWFAAVGTVGALLLGLALFARERQLARRRQADAIVMSRELLYLDDDMDVLLVRFELLNASEKPLPMARLLYQNHEGQLGEAAFEVEDDPQIPSGGRAALVAIFMSLRSQKNEQFVYLVDADGRSWHRDVMSSKYVSEGRMQRWMKKIGGARDFRDASDFGLRVYDGSDGDVHV